MWECGCVGGQGCPRSGGDLEHGHVIARCLVWAGRDARDPGGGGLGVGAGFSQEGPMCLPPRPFLPRIVGRAPAPNLPPQSHVPIQGRFYPGRAHLSTAKAIPARDRGTSTGPKPAPTAPRTDTRCPLRTAESPSPPIRGTAQRGWSPCVLSDQPTAGTPRRARPRLCR